MVYKDNGYYLEWPDKFEYTVAKRVGNSFTGALVGEIFKSCIKHDLFDKDLFEQYKIVSSRGIQKRWLEVMHGLRRKVIINAHYWLISSEETGVYAEETHAPPTFSTQKETKVKEIKKKEIKKPNRVAADKPPPKKSVGKHEKKKEEAEPYWKQLVEVWFDFNTEKFSIKPSFKQQDPKYFKSIILELKKRSAKENVEWTEVVALAIVKKFLCFAYTDPWLQKHFLLKNLSEQFDKIIQLMVAENVPAKKTEDRKLSKDEREINYLYEYYHEGGNIINQMNEEHFELLKRKGLDFTNDEREEIKQATKKYVSENELNLSVEGMKSLQKRFGIIQFFKQQKAIGNVTIFGMD